MGSKPGQKHPTPTPGFGDRVFYETLFRQRPDSEMAQEWCVSYGVLPYEEAEKWNDIILKRKKQFKTLGSPSGGGAATASRKSVAKKKKRDPDDDDPPAKKKKLKIKRRVKEEDY